MSAEHATGGVSAVMAPRPDALLVWLALTCGCFQRFTPPPCFDLQAGIDAWFEQRRDSVAAQMEAGQCP